MILFYLIPSYLAASITTKTDSPKCAYNAQRDEYKGGFFPDDFKFSLATAAYQIEGSVKAEGKGINIWDKWAHQPYPDGHCNIDNCDNADVACNSYTEWKRDIQNIVQMGVKNYRFSLSWARIMPNGTRTNGNKINPAGVKHYSDFIDALIANGITPFVTLYHWDLPQALQDKYSGFLGDQIVDDFADYARTCFQLFGDRVKYWITLNEPQVSADLGYGFGWMAPGVWGQRWTARYNTIRCHSAAYRVYEKEFKTKQNGMCGITLNTNWYEPISDKIDDINAAQYDIDFQLGFWADPIFLTGDYPSYVPATLKKINETLPAFTPEEIARNKNAADFIGINHYTSSLVESCAIGSDNCGWGFREDGCSNWPQAGSSWLKSVPWGIRSLVKYIDNRYDSKKYPIIITENGVSSKGNGTDLEPELNDQWRTDFYMGYIGQLHRAITEDKVNVKAYTAWSLMDNFEWTRGYAERFGMMWTNFTDPNRPVYRKESSRMYEMIARLNFVPGSPNADITDF